MSGTYRQTYPIHQACFDNNEQELYGLIKDGRADLNQLDSRGLTPLHIASKHGYVQTVEMLLLHNADVDIKSGTNGYSSLFYACLNGHLECVRHLLNYGASVNATTLKKEWTALHAASYKKHTEIVKLLLENNADPNALTVTCDTALHFVGMNGNVEIFKLLLEYGVDWNIRNNAKLTAMEVAANNDNLKDFPVSKYSLTTLNYYTSDIYFYPLHTASRYNSTRKLRSLLSCQEHNPNQQDKTGKTPLHVATIHGCIACVHILLKYNAKMNVVDSSGQSALFHACSGGHEKIVQVLLHHGADSEMKTSDQKSPLHGACLMDQLECARLLLLHGANPNVCDNTKNSPLHLSCAIGSAPIVQILFDFGANLKLKNNDGHTPLDLAILNGHLDKLPLLKKYSLVLERIKVKSSANIQQQPSTSKSGDTQLPGLSKQKSSKLQMAVKELIETESAYFYGLAELVKFYIDPFEDPNNKFKLPGSLRVHSSTIFGNIRELHGFHKILCCKLMRVFHSPGQLCQILVDHKEEMLHLYLQYCCRDLHRSQAFFQQNHDDFSCKFLLNCQKKAGHKMPLSSYLVTPLQRITRYPLLLKELSEACCNDSSVSGLVRRTVDEAASRMSELVDCINKYTQQENLELAERLNETTAKNLYLEESLEWLEKNCFLEKSEETTTILDIGTDCPSTSNSTISTNKNSDDSVDKMCSICLEQPKSKTAVNRCGHTFCHECIQQHNEIHSFCPKCRGQIESLLQLYE